MPNCVAFARRSDAARMPVPFVTIDQEIAAHLGLPCDPIEWVRGWYNMIAFRLAMGRTLDEIRQELTKDADPYELLPILTFLEAHFTPDTWAEIGRR